MLLQMVLVFEASFGALVLALIVGWIGVLLNFLINVIIMYTPPRPTAVVPEVHAEGNGAAENQGAKLENGIEEDHLQQKDIKSVEKVRNDDCVNNHNDTVDTDVHQCGVDETKETVTGVALDDVSNDRTNDHVHDGANHFVEEGGVSTASVEEVPVDRVSHDRTSDHDHDGANHLVEDGEVITASVEVPAGDQVSHDRTSDHDHDHDGANHFVEEDGVIAVSVARGSSASDT